MWKEQLKLLFMLKSQHLMHRIIKHHFIDLPYQKTYLVWQHWMNLQPGNEDWYSPKTPKRQQQTKHNEITAKKLSTRKWTYSFPWHTPSVRENNESADFCSTVTSEKRQLLSESTAEFQATPHMLHIFLPPPAIQSGSDLYRLHLRLGVCIQAFTQHMYILYP